MATAGTADKIPYLESLRGLAALSVAIFHFNIGSIFNNGFTNNGWLMVDFFFVLSGFVIALNYQGNIRSFRHLYQFQIRRFLRLYPLHLATLLLFLAIELLKFAGQNLGLDANSDAFSYNDFPSFVVNLFLLQNFFDSAMGWNEPSWSISAEFYTYIFFAACLLLFDRWARLYIALCITITLMTFFIMLDKGMTPYNGIGYVRCLGSFFLGVLCFNLFSVVNIKTPNFIAYLFFFTSISAVIYSGGYYDEKSLLIPLIFAVFIFTLVTSRDKNLLTKFLNFQPLVYLGTISYGIYMIHAALWWFFTQSAKFVFSVPVLAGERGGSQLSFDSAILANLVMLFGLACLILLSHWSYQYLERPMNDFRYKLTQLK